MNESGKKLLNFGIIFVLSGIAIYFYLNSKSQTRQAHPPMATQTDNQVMEQMITELESLRENLQQTPDDFATIQRIANINYDLNQPDSAIVYYEKALTQQPSNAEILTDCAVMYFRNDDTQKALAYLDKAIEINPKLPQAWFNKGFILMIGEEKPAEAIAVWRKFIEIDPESEQSRFIQSQIEAIEAMPDRQ